MAAVDSRTEMVVENGCYTLRDTFDDTTILGWMIQTDDTQYSLSQPDIANQSLAIRGARLPEKGQFDGQWLDERDPLQKPMYRRTGTLSIRTRTSILPSPRALNRSLSKRPMSCI